MNMMEKKFNTASYKAKLDQDEEYLCIRVVDALLRENVRECVTNGTLSDASLLPKELARYFEENQQWLRIDHFTQGSLWIPVMQHDFMQAWRLARLPLLERSASGWRTLQTMPDILACFRDGLPEREAQGFIEFEQECLTALAHRRTCETERKRWFQEWANEKGTVNGANMAAWPQRLLHYDRLAAFHDHPFYPTARAKLGFGVSELNLYSPEFQPEFELNWLAVPRSQYFQSDEALPPCWPTFKRVGLPEHLAATHVLMPVHPFVWKNQLDQLLQGSSLAGQGVRAPDQAMRVTPTLSVRTLALLEAPAWHVKVPLTIRTLGGRNIRTIKPSTIADGHQIQTLLSKIVGQEGSLQGRIVLTDEGTGAHVAHQTFLGFIVRRYPDKDLHSATLVPVAALSADAPSGQKVVDEIVEQFFNGKRDGFLNEYLSLTLQLHLTLWVRYGIALESNQQNSMLVLDDQAPRMRLLLKDNDAARIHRDHLARRWPDLASQIAGLQDQRIVVDGELPLAQMFTTITLQLNIAALVETVAASWKQDKVGLYALVRNHIGSVLAQLHSEGESVAFARQILLDDDHLHIKYLLIAATLLDKEATGAADVNKYYGRSAPNFLRVAQ